MKTNGWLKLAIFSFVGLIISVVLLNVTNPANSGTATSTNNLHNAHVNGTAGVGATMQGTMSGAGSMDQMNEMMQRMNQLQQDMMRMQQQYMSGGQSNMNMGNSGSMGSSGNMGGSGSMMDDDMDMMNMGGGSNMNNGGGSNMNNGGGSNMNNGGGMNNMNSGGSSGSMGMM
ncbi:hypothetical protein [Paenibacillus durus]|nr:hypothetical protein [Paenibacillus durus]